MELVRSAWETNRLANATALPVVVLRLPMGDRAWGFVKPGIGTFGSGFYDADKHFDGDQFFDADSVVLEDAARLLSVDGVEQTARPVDSSVLGSFSQAERPIGAFEVENGDREMSKLIGREYVLRQTAVCYATFPGLDGVDALQKNKGLVTSWTLRKASLRIEFEGL